MTRKNRNSLPGTSASTFGLPKSAILRGHDRFNRLFEQPDAVFSHRHLTMRFYTTAEQGDVCKMGFIVAKKLGKATKRNYVKRLLKEAYRLNCHLLADVLRGTSVGFYGALASKTVTVDFKTVERETIDLLHRTISCVQSL